MPSVVCRVVVLLSVFLLLGGVVDRCASANALRDAFRKTAVSIVADVTTITSDSDDEFDLLRDYVKQVVLPGWDVSLVLVGPNSYEAIRVSGRDHESLLKSVEVVLRARTNQQKLARAGKRRPQGSYIKAGISSGVEFLNCYPDRKRRLVIISDMVAQSPHVLETDQLVGSRPQFSGDGPVDLHVLGVRPDMYIRMKKAWSKPLQESDVRFDIQPASRRVSMRDLR